jgi:hypothetical protein
MEGMEDHACSHAGKAHEVFSHAGQSRQSGKPEEQSYRQAGQSRLAWKSRQSRTGRHAVRAGRQVKSYHGGQGRADQAHIQVVWLGRSGGSAEQAGRSQHAGRHSREAWKTELAGRRSGQSRQTGSQGEAGRQVREDRQVFRPEKAARQHRACRAMQGRAGRLAKQSR